MTQPPGYDPVPRQDTVLPVLVHLSWFAFPLLGPLVVYLVVPQAPLTRANAASALNFHLTALIAGVVSAVLVLVLIGIVMLAVIAVAGTVFSILGAVAAGRGEVYRYPLAISFVH